MLTYILHASLLFAISYFFYWLLLRKETFYKLNRFFLMTALGISFLLPLIQIPTFLAIPNPVNEYLYPLNTTTTSTRVSNNVTSNSMIKAIEETSKAEVAATATKPVNSVAATDLVIEQSTSSSTFNMASMATILKFIYLGGLIIFGLTFLIQLFILLRKKSKLQSMQDGKYKIYELTDDTSPFSFFHWIFINPTKYDLETFNQILEHEKIHVSQAHYFDKMLAELAVVFFWFNPFSWLYRKVITNNLEFLTDVEMLDKGTEKESYQMSLLKVSVPQHALNLTTNYNESFLSERIKMMNVKKSSAKSSWKYLLILPLVGLTMSTLNAKRQQDLIQQPIVESTINDQAIESSIDEGLENSKQEEIKKSTKKVVKEDAKVKAKSNKASHKQEKAKISIQKSGHDSPVVITKSTGNTDVKEIINLGWDHDNIKAGQWQGKVKGGNICFYLNNSTGSNGTWTTTECVQQSEIGDFNFGDNIDFKLERAAGTIYFMGDFNKSEGGFGEFEFEQNETFVSYLESKGFTNVDQKITFQLFMNRSDRDWVEEVLKSGIKPNTKDLLNLGIFKVNEDKLDEYIEIFNLIDAEINTKDMVNFAIHGVDRAFVDGLLMIDNEYLSPKDIVNAKIHNVDPNLTQAAKDFGFSSISMQSLINLSIHGATASTFEEYNKIGYSNLSTKQLTNFLIHGVGPSYIAEVKALGFNDITPSQLVNFKIHGVSSKRIETFVNAGYKDITPQELINTSIHGVSPSDAAELKAIGMDNLELDDLVKFGIHGVTVDYIKGIRTAGFPDIKAHQLVEGAIHGLEVRFIEDIKSYNFTDLSFEKLINAKIHGLTASFIKKAKGKGVESQQLGDYIDLKIHGF